MVGKKSPNIFLRGRQIDEMNSLADLISIPLIQRVSMKFQDGIRLNSPRALNTFEIDAERFNGTNCNSIACTCALGSSDSEDSQ